MTIDRRHLRQVWTLLAVFLAHGVIAVEARSQTKLSVGAVFQDCTECPSMVVIDAGSFVMGSDRTKPKNEKPAHKVAIPGPFAFGQFEVTRRQYFEFADATGREDTGPCWGFKKAVSGSGAMFEKREDLSPRNPGFPQTDDHPVVCVDWEDASAYADWLSRKTGEIYRLPTEAEWEYVTRAGGSDQDYWWGAEKSRERMNDLGTGGNDSWKFSAPVGRFPPNPLSIHDLHGNPMEWVADCANLDYVGAPGDGSAWMDTPFCRWTPLTLLSGYSSIQRGGTSSRRLERRRSSRNANTGFRVVRDLRAE